MKLLLYSVCLIWCCAGRAVHGKPYSSQDVDEELAAESELEKHDVSYIVSRHRFANDASLNDVSGKRRTTKMRKDFDDDFFDELDFDDVVDFDVPSDAELQRATTFTDPVVPLEFRDSAKKKPKKKNLNRRRLMKKMGVDYDAEWMSSEIPPAMTSHDGSESVVTISENQMAELSKQVSKLNLRSELRELSASIDEDIPNVSKLVDVFEQWLVKKSSCPVTFTWIDLGEYFWPRYIKQGKCSKDNDNTDGNKKRKTTTTVSDEYDDDDEGDNLEDATAVERPTGGCSWPEGMKCVQGEAKILHLLRWHCRRRKKTGNNNSSNNNNNNKRRKCKWYKVPYPVISSCKCACQ